MYIPLTVSKRSSSCVEDIFVNVLSGIVDVVYKSGETYRYWNVSKRSILNLVFNKNMSLGFWVNENLLPYDKYVLSYNIT
jgi:hypothetical protein